MKIAIITPYVIPRRISFYNTLSKLSRKYGIEIKLFIIKRKPIHRSHQDFTDYFTFDYVILNSLQYYLKKQELALDVPLNLYSEVRKLQAKHDSH